MTLLGITAGGGLLGGTHRASGGSNARRRFGRRDILAAALPRAQDGRDAVGPSGPSGVPPVPARQDAHHATVSSTTASGAHDVYSETTERDRVGQISDVHSSVLRALPSSISIDSSQVTRSAPRAHYR